MRRVCLVVMLLAVAAAPARASEGMVEASGRCLEIATAVPVDFGAARALVPDRFELQRVGDKALLALFTEECASQVGDGPRTPSFLGGAYIMLDGAGDPSGCESYTLFWSSSSDDDFHRALAGLGWPAELVVGSGFSPSRAGPALSVASAIPLARAPYELATLAVEPVRQLTEVVSVHCAVGPRGVVRGRFSHVPFDVSAGVADVRFGESALWDALGASSGPSAALVFTFDWTGVVEVTR